MEQLNNTKTELLNQETSPKSFIEANTIALSLDEIKSKHIVPVFAKDCEPVISHSDFIELAYETVSAFYDGEIVSKPSVRLSHPIQGRIASARFKPLQYCEESEKTIYYDRMMFAVEVPGISDEIDGNSLSLTIGGVKAYSFDNLYSRKGADERFRLFIGFQNKVCTNLCIWTDGIMDDIKVSNTGHLKACINSLLENYNSTYQLATMRKLAEYSLTEKQFAQLIGRCRMYINLPLREKEKIAPMLFGDQQMNVVVRDFYKDGSFCKDANGNINLWKLYNLFTNANKSTYIDNFLQKEAHAFQFVEGIKTALDEKSSNWFLN
ncbi:MAG: DUF3871 family protein [Chitinophagaceae bacterium]|nr:DUF3871 family protein [Chitinophagaceae bacterium]